MLLLFQKLGVNFIAACMKTIMILTITWSWTTPYVIVCVYIMLYNVSFL